MSPLLSSRITRVPDPDGERDPGRRRRLLVDVAALLAVGAAVPPGHEDMELRGRGVQFEDRPRVAVGDAPDRMGRPGPAGRSIQQLDPRLARLGVARLHDGVDLAARVGLEIHVVVGRQRVTARRREGGLGGPVVVRTAVRLPGEVVLGVELVAPEDAHPTLAADREGDDRRDVVVRHHRPGGRHDGRRRPVRVVSAERVVRVDAVHPADGEGPGRPERPGGILGDHQRLALDPRSHRGREPAIEGVGVAGGVVAVSVEPGLMARPRPGLATVLFHVLRGDVQVRPVPERVGTGARAVVEGRRRPDPRLGAGIEPVDVEVSRRRAPHAGPPGAVVVPELALGLRSGDGVAGGGEVLVTDVRGGGDARADHDKQKQAGSECATESPEPRVGSRPAGSAGREFRSVHRSYDDRRPKVRSYRARFRVVPAQHQPRRSRPAARLVRRTCGAGTRPSGHA